MKAKQVCKLQENLAKEAIAYLMLYGTAVDVTPYGTMQMRGEDGAWYEVIRDDEGEEET